MSQPARGNGQVVAGVIMILVGTLFLLDRFWFFDFGRMVGRFWPSILILIGVLQLAGNRARSWVGPISLIVIGVIFQAQRLNWFDWMRWRYLWPLILIGVGFAILADRLRPLAAPPPANPPPAAGSHPPGHVQAQ
jgi:hypothetical protein